MRGDQSGYPRSGTQKARDETILRVFRESSDVYLSTSEISEQLPIGQRATHNRLEDLAERGHLKKKSVGAGNIWRRAADEEEDGTADAGEVRTGDGGVVVRPGRERHSSLLHERRWLLVLVVGVLCFFGSTVLHLSIIAFALSSISLPFLDLGSMLIGAVTLAVVGLLSFVVLGFRFLLSYLRSPKRG